ncbi:MAG: prenyltransferase [Actinomycetota bacterium]|nr:prenyltransferase [Actinomycetota bacterium]
MSSWPEMGATADAIAACQLTSGAIPHFPGGPTDPWNLVECAMALDLCGRSHDAALALSWLRERQLPDGSWFTLYMHDRPEDRGRDANFCAYAAAGVWVHYLTTSDERFLREMWGVVEKAIDFVLRLQRADGTISWARDVRGIAWPGALLTSSACILTSLRSAIAIAEPLGEERPDWELSASSLRAVVAGSPGAFESKPQFAMDWYYPALSGSLDPVAAHAALLGGWERFVIEGRGSRCVTLRPWVTSAETAELALACCVCGLTDEASLLLEWVDHLRWDDGSYWMGATHPDGVKWPRDRTTWSGAAVVLATKLLNGHEAAEGLFGGSALPRIVELAAPVGDAL